MSEILPLKSTGQFSKWVLDNRDKLGMSQRKLLKLAGLSHATMTKVADNSDLRMSTVAHIAHVFGYRLALVRDEIRDTKQKGPTLSGEAYDTDEG